MLVAEYSFIKAPKLNGWFINKKNKTKTTKVLGGMEMLARYFVKKKIIKQIKHQDKCAFNCVLP